MIRIWALETGGPDQSGWLWCDTILGGLFHSDDGGDSWQLNRPLWDHPDRQEWMGGGADLPGLHSICVDPRDSAQVRVGVSCGGIWSTTDGGESWSCQADGMYTTFMRPERKFDPRIQDAHRFVQCPSQPDCYWVQHHNGIFRSTDNCASWQDVPEAGPSTFGFGVAVHPDDANMAWFVPGINDEKRIPVDGRVVVTRTHDGGQTFDVLTAGLPQEQSYDIVLRHCLEVAADGQALAIGSSTGSLWISEDQGDRWHLVSAHLPPIYSVRFE